MMQSQRITLSRAFKTLLCAAILLAALAACGDDGDAGSNSGELSVSDIWSRPVTGITPDPTSESSSDSHDHHHHHEDEGDPAGVTGVVYMTIENDTDADDRLLSVSSPVAEAAEIHQTTTDDGVMRMRMQESLDIPAGDTVPLEPTGLHIMLIDLTRNLNEGDTFDVELEFEQHGPMTVISTVRTP